MVQEAWLSARGAPDSQSSAVAPRDVVEWAAATKSHLRSLKQLREEARSQLQKDQEVVITANSRRFFAEIHREDRLGNAVVEDRLKKRIAAAKALSAQVDYKLVTLEQNAFALRTSIHEMQRASGMMKGSLAVVEKRMQMRSKRPPTEIVPDEFQESLENEKAILIQARKLLEGQMQVGADMLGPLIATREELHAGKLTMQYDRTGHVQELLESATWLGDKASKLVAEVRTILLREERSVEKANRTTIACMKSRVAAEMDLRRQLENEIKKTRQTIALAELDLDRTQKQLKSFLAQPENFGRKYTDRFDSFGTRVTQQLSKLRIKIKGAAYMGQEGRNLNVLFTRFDRDGSGSLEEEEVRRALRRTLRIPPSVVTDAEISSLCSILDGDKSGHVDIGEILEFLAADTNAEALEEQIRKITDILEQMRAAMQETMKDLRCKTAAWKIDEACSRVNAIKGLELDNLPSPGRRVLPATSPGKAGPSLEAAGKITSPRSAPAEQEDSQLLKNRSSMALEPAVLEALRSKLKAAAYIGHAGRQLDAVFTRFDRNGSGSLEDEEVRRAIRRTLRIPPSVISDSEISAWCHMLDSDHSGAVSIREIVNFVGPEPEVCRPGSKDSKRSAKPSAGAALEPINKVDSPITQRPGTSGQMQRPATSGGAEPGSKLGSPPSRRQKPEAGASLEPISKASPRPQGKSKSPATRRRCPPLSSEQIEIVRSKMKAAAYTGHAGKQLDVIFGRFDKDGSGRLEDDEVRIAIRKTLRIAPTTMTDAEVYSLCALLDVDSSGTVGLSEIVKFVEAPQASDTASKDLEMVKTAEPLDAPMPRDAA